MIKARRRELDMSKAKQDVTNKSDDDIGSRRKLALLDILLQSTIDGKPLTDLDIREEVDTFVVSIFSFDLFAFRSLIMMCGSSKVTIRQPVESHSASTVSPSILMLKQSVSKKYELSWAMI